jgi:DNA mismatch endonuclease (patch repair protein)
MPSTQFADTPLARSRIMRAIRSKDTTPEMIVRRTVHRLGYRYRLHCRQLPGRPDLVFASRRRIIFVHGCFWHGHQCKGGWHAPSVNTEFWALKIARNRQRDKVVAAALEGLGWRLLVIRECETKDREALAERLKAFLTAPAT